MASKNQNRHIKKATNYRKDADGVDIKPTLYVGPFGKYMAGTNAKGDLVCDKAGKPINYKSL